ncbi:hypothetical protein, partial [Burkholderia gladioli]|uniref:hypothetical protein n=2 Tax=Burkholderia TaxID=32008 RepID=UPI0015E47086
MAITHAKIGRSIKNFAMKQAPCDYAPEAAVALAAEPAAAPLAGAADDAPEAPAAPEAPEFMSLAALGRLLASLPAFWSGGSCAATGLTVMPGWTLPTPCTITR